MRRLLPAAVLGLALAAGCGRSLSPGAATSGTRLVTLPENTPVSLMLLRRIDSGGTAEGVQVPLMVDRPVIVDGTVMVPAGTFAMATVTRSRRATTFSAVVNQPARLELRMDPILFDNGQKLTLRGPDDKMPDTIPITQRLVAGIREDGASKPASKAVTRVAQALVFGNGAIDETTLREVANQQSLTALRSALEKGKAASLVGALRRIQAGQQPVLDPIGISLVGAALGEIAVLANAAGRRLGGIFKGNNIVALPGTNIEVRTVGTFTIKAPAG